MCLVDPTSAHHSQRRTDMGGMIVPALEGNYFYIYALSLGCRISSRSRRTGHRPI